MARLFYWLGRLDEAEPLYRKAAKVDASDPEALYGIAVLDWVRAYGARSEERIRLNLKQKQPLFGLPPCQELRTKNLSGVGEGIELLTRTSQFVSYVDMQVCMALFYRERAGLQCGDRSAYQRDLR